ncbi:MAG: hypothetical protein AB8B86_13420 [Pseudomonadales bacterium]
MKPLPLATSLLIMSAASITMAETKVTGTAQAFAACKAAIHRNHDDVQQVKLLGAKSSTRPYKLIVRVKRNDAKQKSVCLVTRDGDVKLTAK